MLAREVNSSIEYGVRAFDPHQLPLRYCTFRHCDDARIRGAKTAIAAGFDWDSFAAIAFWDESQNKLFVADGTIVVRAWFGLHRQDPRSVPGTVKFDVREGGEAAAVRFAATAKNADPIVPMSNDDRRDKISFFIERVLAPKYGGIDRIPWGDPKGGRPSGKKTISATYVKAQTRVGKLELVLEEIARYRAHEIEQDPWHTRLGDRVAIAKGSHAGTCGTLARIMPGRARPYLISAGNVEYAAEKICEEADAPSPKKNKSKQPESDSLKWIDLEVGSRVRIFGGRATLVAVDPNAPADENGEIQPYGIARDGVREEYWVGAIEPLSQKELEEEEQKRNDAITRFEKGRVALFLGKRVEILDVREEALEDRDRLLTPIFKVRSEKTGEVSFASGLFLEEIVAPKGEIPPPSVERQLQQAKQERDYYAKQLESRPPVSEISSQWEEEKRKMQQQLHQQQQEIAELQKLQQEVESRDREIEHLRNGLAQQNDEMRRLQIQAEKAQFAEEALRTARSTMLATLEAVPDRAIDLWKAWKKQFKPAQLQELRRYIDRNAPELLPCDLE